MHAYFYFMVTLSFPRELLLIQQVRESSSSSKLNLIQPFDNFFLNFSPALAKWDSVYKQLEAPTSSHLKACLPALSLSTLTAWQQRG